MKFFVRLMFALLFCLAFAFAAAWSHADVANQDKVAELADHALGQPDEVDYLLSYPADNMMLPLRNSFSSSVAKWQKTLSLRIRCEKRQLYRLIKSDNSHLSLDNKYHEINHLIGSVEDHLHNSSRRFSARFLLTFNEIFRI